MSFLYNPLSIFAATSVKIDEPSFLAGSLMKGIISVLLFAVVSYCSLRVIQSAAKGNVGAAKKYIVGAIVSSIVIVWVVASSGYIVIAEKASAVFEMIFNMATGWLV